MTNPLNPIETVQALESVRPILSRLKHQADDAEAARALELVCALLAQMQSQPSDDLHAAIMNLPCNPPQQTMTRAYFNGYIYGHLDARHAAAELVAARAASQPSDEREAQQPDGDCWLWMTHPSWFDGRPVPVWTVVEGGVRWYMPFDPNSATDFEWGARDPEWQIVAAPQAQQ